jgi:hypothetical protein
VQCDLLEDAHVWKGGVMEWWNVGKSFETGNRELETGRRMDRGKERIERNERKMPDAPGVPLFSAATRYM